MIRPLILLLKGVAIGIANVIPGVSGGTIALITGVFERLINAIKSFNLNAIKLLAKGKFKEFALYTDFGFLAIILSGMVIAVFTVARIFDFLFEKHPVYIWSFFFGLIIASIWYVFKTISKWNLSVVISGIIAAAIALGITFVTPASENNSTIYLMICGAVSICSMILPGLSGSYVLLIMGNYRLVAIDAINTLNIGVLIPFFVGAAVGLLAFSYVLSWLFKQYRNETLSVLTGFMVGSIGVLWPWKNEIKTILDGKDVVTGYNWYLPEINIEFFVALVLMVLAVVMLFALEQKGKRASKQIT